MENRILKNKMCNKNKILLEKYISVFENLKEDNLDGLKELIAKDVYFEDPFQKTQGRNEYIKIFQDMFLKLDKPTFKVLDYSISENLNNNCFMKWILRGKLKNNNRNISIKGMSEVSFDQKGNVKSHIDYWDTLTQIIIKLPYIGFFLEQLLKIFFKYKNI